MQVMQSLESYLTQEDPEFEGNKKGKSQTRNDKWPTLETAKFTKWREFTKDTLYACFGNRVRAMLTEESYELPSMQPFYQDDHAVENEDDVTAILWKFYHGPINLVLRQTAPRLIKQKVQWMAGGKAGIIYAGSRNKPDWAGVREPEGCDPPLTSGKPNNILPGESKPSWNWSTDAFKKFLEKSNRARGGGENRGEKAPLPLRQIAFYCIYSYARYGYIITDKELFIVRIGIHHPERENGYEPLEFREAVADHPEIYYTSVPWTNTAENPRRLTVSMALWALHILAANDGYLLNERHSLKRWFPPLRKTQLGQRNWFPPPIPEDDESDIPPHEKFVRDTTPNAAEEESDEESIQDGPHYSAPVSLNTSFERAPEPSASMRNTKRKRTADGYEDQPRSNPSPQTKSNEDAGLRRSYRVRQ